MSCESSGTVSSICGDGVVDGAEACDGEALDGNDCSTVGFDAGTLLCSASCDSFITTSCSYVTCGDGVVGAGEDCDGPSLGGASCVSQGFDGGILGCTSSCEFDTGACTTSTCGNGAIDGGIGFGEECDGALLGGADCISEGFPGGGVLACAANCTFDTRGCAPTLCGDGTAQGSEVCDGADLSGQTCESQGFAGGGTLACAGGCGSFVTTGCIAQSCGDGVRQGAEVCDGADLAGGDCTDFGFTGGTLACEASCDGHDRSGCTGGCGNGVVEGSEYCDGAALGGRTCANIGAGGGMLTCDANCHALDLSGCTEVVPATCGDGDLDALEVCDGAASRYADCETAGLGLGALGCRADCTLDLSDCLYVDACAVNGLYGDGSCDDCELFGGGVDPDCATACEAADGTCSDRWIAGAWRCLVLGTPDPDCGTCGDGARSGIEACDGADLGGVTCGDYGYAGGALACGPSCQLDFGGCVPAACGDGILDTGEVCDGSELGATACTDLGFTGGILACAGGCDAFDLLGCTGGCGNAATEAGEACDGADLAGSDCADFGYAGGALGCRSDCSRFDTSACEVLLADSCGDGIANGNESCDGNDFVLSRACTMHAAGAGTVFCKPDCTLDFSRCTLDFCTANGFYDDGSCVPCERFDSARDEVDCVAKCSAADGTCADNLVNDQWTCLALGIRDPDCTGTCGDGVSDAGEQCDGADVPSTCESFNFKGGTLGCRSNCTYDFSACTSATCGDGVLEGDERCDGADLGGRDCAALGLISGALACKADCSGFETAGCNGGPTTACGDGVVNGHELCDGPLTGTCADVGLGLGAGAPTCVGCVLDWSPCERDACALDDRYVDGVCDECPSQGGIADPDCLARCTLADGTCRDRYVNGAWTCRSLGLVDPDCGTCGNGTLEGNELCDGAVIPQTCTDFGFADGTLGCRANCTYDFSACEPPTCGNSIVNGWEICDGTDLRGEDCASLGYAGGTLACAVDCTFATSTCTGGCGNGLREDAEACDGTDLGGATCASAGFEGGTLACGAACDRFDTAGCTPYADLAHHCGDGVVNGLELCDGASFAGPSTCNGYGLPGGDLRCTADCVPDFGPCVTDYCDDRGLYGDGACFPLCEAYGGGPDDPDCAAACTTAGDGCTDQYLFGHWTCGRRGLRDPDCGTCGNGILEGHELCDGAALAGTCSDYGFASGALSCLPSCVPDFGGCMP